ncbi:hypothetical protein [Paracoccus kondratievae]|uniref:Translation initiation factor 2 n=1 Tax=Paracoccus kondratievae TaxID=135740 RepID=A0AAD3NY85_9RHOB|nr:hypothetical protein [Paracoccus kondratievae]GLK63953.1 hypothetical protein GCM10017635_14240 [Paracoccus kondratievae]
MSLDSAPEYALSFSEDAVHLQRRDRVLEHGDGAAPAGWRHLGSVDFSAPDFRDDFVRLRNMATGSDEVLPVTLIIPDDQILYTTLTVAPGADRELAVGRALDGLTPYKIQDLAFDWEGDGDSVRVAAVARQTLREAREFAEQYGFEGQGFCATPPADLYPGEPVFVLDPVRRPRPRIGLTQAGVTAGALLIDDEAQKETTAQAALDLQGSPDEPAVESGPDEVPAAADEQAKISGASPKDEPASEAATEGEAATSVDDGAVEDPASAEAVEDKEEPAEEADPVAAEAPVEPQADDAAAEAEETVSAADAEPASDAAEAQGDAASEAAPVETAAEVPTTEADDAPVASDEPATPHVAAEDHPAAPANAGLNPRARAVHERAAGARQARSLGGAPAQPRRPGERGGLVSLLGMLGALVVGLILIWAFLVPEKDAPQIAGTVPEQQTAPQTPAEPGIAPTGEQPAAAQPETSAGQVAVSEPAAPPVSALTEEEKRRVIVAAAAVAAAVVPPSVTPATPSAPVEEPVTAEPALTATADPQPADPQPAETQPAETRPAENRAAEAPAPTQPRAQAPAQTTARAPAPAQRPSRAVVTQQKPAPAATQLTSSARPQLAPRRAAPQTTTPRADSAPRVPSDPLPYEASQRKTQPISGARPPERARRAAPAASGAAVQPPPAATDNSRAATLRGSARPPSRPEGSTPEVLGAVQANDELTPAEQLHLRLLIQDLGRSALVTGLPDPSPDARLAQVRPPHKPGGASPATASDAVSPSAIDAAIRSATTPPPDRPERVTAAAPARDSGGLLRGSPRPPARSGRAAIPSQAVEEAISAAVAASPATPGGVQLSALASSPLPPRRGDAPVAAAAAAAPDVPAAAPEPPAAAGPSEAELAARRKLDEQLQAQAEARIRARAAADAKAEAEARAQAEARARAQAEAEERAARARRQEYKPPEVDNEPEIAAAALSKSPTSASVAKAATQPRGLNVGRTTIIGIIGAGKASRALIRLRNGKVVTVRIGDRIDGGTINSIGDGRLTYVKAGRVHELRMLDGR